MATAVECAPGLLSRKDTTTLSKTLSGILRWKSEEYGITLDNEGFAGIQLLLSCRNSENGRKGIPEKFTETHIRKLVEADTEKVRFTINGDMIRANQGHSNRTPLDDSKMHTALTEETLPDYVAHGTSEENYQLILDSGCLKRMERHHVHMAGSPPTDKGKIPGVRNSCTVIIEIDCVRAMQPKPVGNSCRFLRSSNGVILCAEDIPTSCFKSVSRR